MLFWLITTHAQHLAPSPFTSTRGFPTAVLSGLGAVLPFRVIVARSGMTGVGYTCGLVPVENYILAIMCGCYGLNTDSSERRGYSVRGWFGSKYIVQVIPCSVVIQQPQRFRSTQQTAPCALLTSAYGRNPRLSKVIYGLAPRPQYRRKT